MVGSNYEMADFSPVTEALPSRLAPSQIIPYVVNSTLWW